MSQVDWSNVKTERQQAEEAILAGAGDLAEKMLLLGEEIHCHRESHGAMTPDDVAEFLEELATGLGGLACLFRNHLKVVDLDDTAKAIGVGPDAADATPSAGSDRERLVAGFMAAAKKTSPRPND